MLINLAYVLVAKGVSGSAGNIADLSRGDDI